MIKIKLGNLIKQSVSQVWSEFGTLTRKDGRTDGNTHTHTHTHYWRTDAGNYNTHGPKLTSGKKPRNYGIYCNTPVSKVVIIISSLALMSLDRTQ